MFARLAVPLSFVVASCSVPSAPTQNPVAVASDTKHLVEPDLKDACDRYEAGHEDQPTLLACGKWMFFYESFGTFGVPASLPTMFTSAFSDEVGPGFEQLGLIADPHSKDALPFGMAPGKPVGLSPSTAFTCASCHLAELPDGRLVIGAPNHRYRYGDHLLTMTVFPFVATGGPEGHDDKALEVLAPLVHRLEQEPKIWAELGGAMMQALASFQMPDLSPEIERAYASWPAGTQDFVITPLPVDDHVVVVGKIPPLFELPRPDEVRESGMIHGMYGWSGNAYDLFSFLHGFIALGGGKPENWPDSKLRPLVEYLYSLRAPPNPDPPSPALARRGEKLFRSQGCVDCHDGPRHSGKRIYSFEEIGTDATLARWLDPEGRGEPCCGADIEDPLTGGVKSPRLTALWLQERFLHNGALSSLEQLFCLEPRPTAESPLNAEGHDETCDGISDAQKRALIAYLETL